MQSSEESAHSLSAQSRSGCLLSPWNDTASNEPFSGARSQSHKSCAARLVEQKTRTLPHLSASPWSSSRSLWAGQD